MWSGKLGEINVTSYPIDVITVKRPYKSASYRTGPKTRDLERYEISKQLAAGVIEPDYSTWASPELLAPKNDGSF